MVKKESGKITAGTNRKAFHKYQILESYEAGIRLRGPEVKSLRAGKANLEGSFARVENGEIFLHNLHISPYQHHATEVLEPERTRKLLLKRGEIHRILGWTQSKGASLVPLEIYFKNGWAKVALGLAKGKKGPDRREEIKKRDVAREVRRSFRRG